MQKFTLMCEQQRAQTNQSGRGLNWKKNWHLGKSCFWHGDLSRGRRVNDQFDGAITRIAKLLESHRLTFALIGGLASSIRGRLRVTADIDIVVDCEVVDAIAILEELDSKSFRPFVADPETSVRQFYVLPIEDIASRTPIDLAIGASGFEKLVVQRAVRPEGYPISVATAEDLLLMKVMAGRPQDENDVQGIVLANKDTIDWDYCIEIASQLQEAFDLDLVEAVSSLRQ